MAKFSKAVLAVAIAALLAVLAAQAAYGIPIIIVLFKPPYSPPTIEVEAPSSSPIEVQHLENATLPSTPQLEYVRAHLKITLNKQQYHVGEIVEITFTNEGNKTVELMDPPWAVFKNTSEGWINVYEPKPKMRTELQYDVKRGKYVEVEVPETVKIEPHGSFTWKWNMTAHGEPLQPGCYAIALQDDLYVAVEGKALRIMNIGGLTVKSLDKPFAQFTVLNS